MSLRSVTCASLLLFLSAAAAPAVLAAEDQTSSVLADCGSGDLPYSQVDSCLERVRVLDETDPSPQLESLEAQLESRETGPRAARQQPRPPQSSANSEPSGMTPYQSQPTVVQSGQELPADAAEPDQSRTAASEVPTTVMPDERRSDEERGSIDTGSDRPPPGINEDQPPVADPPDGDTSRDEIADPPDDQR
jgi:hypothetical protein